MNNCYNFTDSDDSDITNNCQDDVLTSIEDHYNSNNYDNDYNYNDDNYDNEDSVFTSILNKYIVKAKADSDIVSLVELIYNHIDDSLSSIPDEVVSQFKQIVIRIVPGRTADALFEILNKIRQGQEYDTTWINKLPSIERSLVCEILVNIMVLLYEKDIPIERKMQIKNIILTYSIFINRDSDCTIL